MGPMFIRYLPGLLSDSGAVDWNGINEMWGYRGGEPTSMANPVLPGPMLVFIGLYLGFGRYRSE